MTRFATTFDTSETLDRVLSFSWHTEIDGYYFYTKSFEIGPCFTAPYMVHIKSRVFQYFVCVIARTKGEGHT